VSSLVPILSRGLLLVALLSACESFVPLRNPPALREAEPPGSATTRDELIAQFGPPAEVRAADTGQVLVYRRPIVVDRNPARYYGEDRGDQLVRYDRILIYLDPAGQVVRSAIEPE
jgi:hypothetical protein